MADAVDLYAHNPFSPLDEARHSIWEMLVARDIEAFVAADWAMVAGDFVPDEFMGVDGRKTGQSDHWQLAFPDLASYRDEWLRQARAFQGTRFAEDAKLAIFRATVLRDIDIQGERAIARKKFNGAIALADGSEDRLLWQTLYYCKRTAQGWKISGFTGYLPNPMA
ncbi:hypothetical protein [Polycladidibacter hongkongensis]|uniref:hypothetical protein n=1 Tax=Polycladidibacter hongkongensis TaxID=1647556 RepID=UPI0008325182|nr:hypothetical protein [Pseudovibrio hongkongensis]